MMIAIGHHSNYYLQFVFCLIKAILFRLKLKLLLPNRFQNHQTINLQKKLKFLFHR